MRFRFVGSPVRAVRGSGRFAVQASSQQYNTIQYNTIQESYSEICLKHIFPRGYPLDLHGHMYILQGGTLRICMEIPIFPKRHPLDLYGNTHILQGVTLGICMKIRDFQGDILWICMKYVYFTRVYP